MKSGEIEHSSRNADQALPRASDNQVVETRPGSSEGVLRMNDILEALVNNLDREIDERKAMLALVEQEGRTIQSGDHEELDATLLQIRAKLEDLPPLERERAEYLERIGGIIGNSDRGSLTLTLIAEAVGGRDGDMLLARRDELRTLLRDTMARNRQNQYLLRFASSMLNDTLDMLITEPTGNKTYSQSGTQGTPGRDGTLFRAKV